MATKQTKTNGNKGPAFQKRIGSVRGSVWLNSSEGRTYFNTTLVRRFKDGDEWREVATYNGAVDVVAAQEVLKRCLQFIHEQEDAAESLSGDE